MYNVISLSFHYILRLLILMQKPTCVVLGEQGHFGLAVFHQTFPLLSSLSLSSPISICESNPPQVYPAWLGFVMLDPVPSPHIFEVQVGTESSHPRELRRPVLRYSSEEYPSIALTDKGIFHKRKLTLCHYLITFMSFQRHMTDLLQFNTKSVYIYISISISWHPGQFFI